MTGPPCIPGRIFGEPIMARAAQPGWFGHDRFIVSDFTVQLESVAAMILKQRIHLEALTV